MSVAAMTTTIERATIIREELDDYTSLLVGDCRAAMWGLSARSVHVIVTSIPYFGLRAYGTDPQLWGAEPTCPHLWGAQEPPKRARWGDPTTLSAKQRSNGGSAELVTATDPNGGCFCQLCSAWRGEWGSEPDVRLFVQNTVEVFAAAWHVLRNDGVAFLNIGDSWAHGKPKHGYSSTGQDLGWENTQSSLRGGAGLKELDLCLVPERLAIALQDAGWYVRSRIIRQSRNPMPESVGDWRYVRCMVKTAPAPRAESGTYHAEASRPQGARDGAAFASTAKREPCPGCRKCEANDGYVLRRGSGRPAKSHEHIWMLTKAPGNYWDCEAVRQANLHPERSGKRLWTGAKMKMSESADFRDSNAQHRKGGMMEAFLKNGGIAAYHPGGHNLRDVWPLTGQPYAGAHFATFPESLPATAIKAASSEAGCCPMCGACWARVMEPSAEYAKHFGSNTGADADRLGEGYRKHSAAVSADYKTLGWRPTCKCPAHDPEPCTVLDFCGGSGTTAVAARRLKRRSLLVELKPEYCGLLRERVLAEPWGGKPVKRKRIRKALPVPVNMPVQRDLFSENLL